MKTTKLTVTVPVTALPAMPITNNLQTNEAINMVKKVTTIAQLNEFDLE
jgi:hypothetical protein